MGLSLLVLGAGCVGDEAGNLLVPANPFPTPVNGVVVNTQVAYTAASKEAGERVLQLGHKLLYANPQIGLRPFFVTIGVPTPEVFHRGSRVLYITEGLTRQCKTEGQLAAILCLELGKMVAEREALASPETRLADLGPPADVPVGNDYRPGAGDIDGTRLLELSHYEHLRRRAGTPVLPPPAPDVLARGYLQKAGFSPAELSDAAPLLQAAEASSALERQLTGQQGVKPL
jgi:hypothetical protein